MSEETKVMGEQLEKVRASLPELFLAEQSFFTRLTGRKIISPGSEAVWSMHDIAHHLLTLPDEDVMLDSEYGLARFSEDQLPEPKVAAVAAVYESVPTSLRSRLVSTRTERVPFHWVKS